MKTTILIFLFSLLIIEIGYAQSERDYSNDFLAIKHQQKQKVKFMKAGKKINFWLYGDDEKHKGKFRVKDENTIVVDSIEFPIENIRKLGGRSTGMQIAKIIGGTVTGAGTIFGGIGILMLRDAKNSNDACGGAIVMMMGYTLAIVGTAAIVIGGIPFVFNNRKYDLENKWELSTIEALPRNRKAFFEKIENPE
ncbi:MAG: hypothetical protein C0594_10870 [Marinilabiliales bacterium]|nr:MAG: hypothetical protein C0594_10870 [Marinilabiliales bacterium]